MSELRDKIAFIKSVFEEDRVGALLFSFWILSCAAYFAIVAGIALYLALR